jgi:hypothetical protein
VSGHDAVSISCEKGCGFAVSLPCNEAHLVRQGCPRCDGRLGPTKPAPLQPVQGDRHGHILARQEIGRGKVNYAIEDTITARLELAGQLINEATDMTAGRALTPMVKLDPEDHVVIHLPGLLEENAQLREQLLKETKCDETDPLPSRKTERGCQRPVFHKGPHKADGFAWGFNQ